MRRRVDGQARVPRMASIKAGHAQLAGGVPILGCGGPRVSGIPPWRAPDGS
jgi:hypothetical protein